MSRAPVFADGLDEIAQEFLVESYENLDELDRALVQLEKEPGSRPLLASIFRTIHTIKGTSGFLAFNRLEAVTHVGENVLSNLRDGKLELTPEIATTLLRMVDVVRELLGAIERTGGEGDIDTAAVESALARCLEPGAEAVDVQPAAAPAAAVVEPSSIETPDPTPAEVPVTPAYAEPDPDASLDFPVIDPFLEHGPDGLHEDVHEASDDSDARRSVADSSIRVDVGLLDQLMRMVGELVLTRNQVVRHVGDVQHVELQRASQRLNLLATELQEGVMKTRMQPIGQIWGRLPRVVRDLGAQCGKQVRLEMEGRETELDRTLLEAVKDPLTHLVRNAVDHGLESPEARVAAGKPAEGTLLLRSYHEGGQVVVEVTDDGGGIDPARISAKALEHGLVNREQVARMNERELLDLIFMPGFSTAAEVTNVSGRGVGMDVVRTNIEKIGGSVDLVSKLGQGTTVRVRIPLTLAIIPALVVAQGGDSYAIPQANLLELVRVEADTTGTGVEYVGGAPVYRLRGTLLPLVFLDEQLELERDGAPSAYNIVVLSSDHAQFGLVVQDIQDTQEIVVQPLSRLVKHVDVFAGATITGDGRVTLILDVSGLALRATANPAQVGSQRVAAVDAGASTARETTQLVICQVGDDRRLALPMTDVARLEEIPVSDVERAGSTEVVQYRGDLLRLVHVGDLLGIHGSGEPPSTYSVVVHRDDDEAAVGLVVDRILDVVEEEIRLSEVGLKHGLHGSAELQSRVTDIVDVPALVAAARGGF